MAMGKQFWLNIGLRQKSVFVMGRYRPPAPKGSAYITAEGAAALRAELHQLWKVERPQVTAAVHEAAKKRRPL